MNIKKFVEEWTNDSLTTRKTNDLNLKLKSLNNFLEETKKELTENKRKSTIIPSIISGIITVILHFIFYSKLSPTMFYDKKMQGIAILMLISTIITGVLLIICNIYNSKLEANKNEIEPLKDKIKECKKEKEKIQKISKEAKTTVEMIEKYNLKKLLEKDLTIERKTLMYYLENDISLFGIVYLINKEKKEIKNKPKASDEELLNLKETIEVLVKSLEQTTK